MRYGTNPDSGVTLTIYGRRDTVTLDYSAKFFAIKIMCG